MTALSDARRQAEDVLSRIAKGDGVETPHLTLTLAESALRALLAATADAERLLREVAEGGVEFEDERVRYVAVQIDAETWAGVKRFAATAPAPQPAQTLTRAEAIAAGIPIPPDAVGVRIWGASVTAPAPQPEATEFIDVVFDGPPEHVSGRFVEVEDSNGRSIRFGHWVKRADGYWALRFAPAPPAGDGGHVLHEGHPHGVWCRLCWPDRPAGDGEPVSGPYTLPEGVRAFIDWCASGDAHTLHATSCHHGLNPCLRCRAKALAAAPKPAGDGVREAAERLREALPNYTAMSAECDCPTCLTLRLLAALDAAKGGAR